MAWRPVLVLLVLAPYLGEVSSTATGPLDLVLPWNLVLFVALYGCGALLCREVAVRCGSGLRGLVLLGAAYGVFEEALVDRFWFDPDYARHTGVGDYAEVWHTNLLLATHLTVFHAAVSVCASVLIVSWLFPADRDRPWLPAGWLALPGAALLLVPFVTAESYARAPFGPAVAAAGLVVLLTAAAFLPRRVRVVARTAVRRGRPRTLGVLAFLATGLHFGLVYAMPSTGLPWPAGLAVAVAPVVVGVLAVRAAATTGPLGRDGLWVVTGIVGFFAVLDVLVGLGGRYDLSVAGVGTALGLGWLHRRVARSAPAATGHPASPEALSPDG